MNRRAAVSSIRWPAQRGSAVVISRVTPSLPACAPSLCGATHVADVSQGTSGVSRTGRTSGGPGVPKRLVAGLLRNKGRLGPFHMQLPSRETSFVCT